MELRKEYEEAIDAGIAAFAANGVMSDALKVAVERCQQLADRPPRELTDAEIDRLWPVGLYRPEGDYTAPRRFIAAIHAKQREPQVVKFRAARRVCGEVGVFTELPDSAWEWLDADGKAQEIEVRI